MNPAWPLAAMMMAQAPPPAGAAPVEVFPSVAETRAELEEVCRRLRESDAPFFGDAVLRRLEADLAAGAGDPARELLLRERLAFELLRVGRNEEAVGTLTRLLASPPVSLAAEARRRLLFSLAVAHLRLSELQNCAATGPGEGRCILPFAGAGLHSRPEHGRAAGDVLAKLLAEEPDHAQARWLLNLARMATGDYPQGVPEPLRLPAGAFAPEVRFPRWREIAGELGVGAMDLAGGAVMDDLDGDGVLDLVSSTMDPCGPLKAFRGDGRGGFADVSEAWGLAGQLGGLNLLQADYDNDGRLDLLVLRGGWMGRHGAIRKSLLRNDLARPAGRFVDVTAAAGLAYPAYPSQAAAWADFDADGDLDLYVGNESETGAGPPGDPGAAGPAAPAGRTYPSQLFRNNGDGTFTDAARAAGVAGPGFAKGVAAGDFDDDGRPDLYVSCIGPNRMYRNNGDGTFTDLAARLGVAEPAGPSFATWFFDYDNDGDLDLFVAAYGARASHVAASYLGLTDKPGSDPGHPLLYRNDVKTAGRFTDVSRQAGLTRPLLPMGANHGDLDNDGWLDLYLGTGVPDFAALMPNVMLHSVADPAAPGGRRFEDVSFAGGFAHLQKGHGVAFGDLDNDGDQDLFEQLGGAYPADAFANALWENPGPAGAWITLRLAGRRANRFGVGARIEVVVRERGGARRSIHRLAGSGGSFGCSSLQEEIGLGAPGTVEAVESVTVRWPGSGTVQVFRDVAPGRAYQAVEGEPRLVPVELARFRLGGERRDRPPGHVHPGEKR